VGVRGLFSCVGDHILQEFNTTFLTRFRNLQNHYTNPNKNLEGEGKANFLDNDMLSISLIFLRCLIGKNFGNA
jgi:hypothetical protein